MSGNLFGARGMHEAEANDPGFIHRHGWTHFECADCADVIYDGRLISAQDTDQLVDAHKAACPAPASPPQVPLWHRLFGRATP